jgi:hypothetical protein
MKLLDTEKEEIWYEVMENYVMTAELGHLAKDQKAHKDEMRNNFADLIAKIDSILEKKEKDIQMSADGKYINYQGKIYVYEDEKFKELNNK